MGCTFKSVPALHRHLYMIYVTIEKKENLKVLLLVYALMMNESEKCLYFNYLFENNFGVGNELNLIP